MDYAATTPVLPEVRREMEKYWSEDFYNPSSMYQEGVRAKKALGECRARVARALGVASKAVVFTSGGTESANLAILGAFESFAEVGGGPTPSGFRGASKKPHMILSTLEHPAVREAALEVKRRGGSVSFAEVDEYGFVSPETVEKLIKPNTFMVSVMLANNELGTLEPVAHIGRVVKEARKKRGSEWPYFHTDASQAPNYMPINLENLNADLLTLDGSKIYGPKGVGVLVVRPSVKIRPILMGGDQESGLRPGTESLALISGFTRALEIAARDRAEETTRLRELQDYFAEKIEEMLSGAKVNTPLGRSVPNIISVSIPGILSELVLLALDAEGLMVSVGSACASGGSVSGSDALRAIGREDLAESTLRFSFGRMTTKKEVDEALNIFFRVLAKPTLTIH